jgi:hypothetical protein
LVHLLQVFVRLHLLLLAAKGQGPFPLRPHPTL